MGAPSSNDEIIMLSMGAGLGIRAPGASPRLAPSTVARGKGSLDKVLSGAKPGAPTKGRTTQFEKSGGFDQAGRDFDSLGLSDVTDIPGGGRAGQLPDGRTVVVRPSSKGGPPTLEVQAGRNRIKIRFGE